MWAVWRPSPPPLQCPLARMMASGRRSGYWPASKQPGLPSLAQLIIVEGLTDCQAVQRAANVAVYVCDGSMIKSQLAVGDLDKLRRWPHGLVVLTDPDQPGRMLRMYLDDVLGQQGMPLVHAFLPASLAVSTTANSRHDIGSIGVENASSAAILASLQSASPSYPATRKEFSAQELQERGFVNSFDAKQTNGAKLRRRLLCAALGIDDCTGGSLITTCNRYFSRAQLEAAIDQVGQQVAAMGALTP
ncbi:hypothetical protein V8C86DRAFT_2612356 [Haematococcus lacustris]